MIVPDGHTEQEVIDTITRVAKRVANKHRFAYFDGDDIFQEAFIIGMEGLSRYDPSKPLENFMSVHISNRIKNEMRKHLGRPEDKNTARTMLMSPLSMDVVRDEEEANMWTRIDFLDDLQVDDIFKLIDLNLPTEYRADFLRMKQGVTIPKPRREKIEEYIINILRENGYETW